jgi:hypothetical protein
MIAYIDLPLRGTYTVNGHDVLIVAMYFEHGLAGCVFVDQDGSMGQGSLADFNINWRFSDKRRKWLDVDTGEELGSDDDDGDSTDQWDGTNGDDAGVSQ